ncbi:MAG: SPASM domain-containing protein [bacterium]|nr:SPASM domain-containing protein [bacterium]
MSRFLDPLIPRKSDIVDEALRHDENGRPLPSIVEISESGICNRKCSFCPRSAPDYPDIGEFIDASLVEKLACQLNEVGFKGIFLFSGFVEPLLDKNIFNLVALVRQTLKDSRIEIVTNGDMLNDKRLKRLFKSGLSTLLVSVYGKEEAIRLGKEETLRSGKEEALRFEFMCKNAGLRKDQYEIRHRYLPPEQDFGITLSNRAGMMANAEHVIPALTESLKRPCYYPHYTFFMDYKGDVLQCPHDWGKKFIVGNMKTQDFKEIWFGKRLTYARKKLAQGDRGYSPCNVCDVNGTLIGKKHVESWAVFDQAGRKDTGVA